MPEDQKPLPTLGDEGFDSTEGPEGQTFDRPVLDLDPEEAEGEGNGADDRGQGDRVHASSSPPAGKFEVASQPGQAWMGAAPADGGNGAPAPVASGAQTVEQDEQEDRGGWQPPGEDRFDEVLSDTGGADAPGSEAFEFSDPDRGGGGMRKILLTGLAVLAVAGLGYWGVPLVLEMDGLGLAGDVAPPSPAPAQAQVQPAPREGGAPGPDPPPEPGAGDGGAAPDQPVSPQVMDTGDAQVLLMKAEEQADMQEMIRRLQFLEATLEATQAEVKALPDAQAQLARAATLEEQTQILDTRMKVVEEAVVALAEQRKQQAEPRAAAPQPAPETYTAANTEHRVLAVMSTLAWVRHPNGDVALVREGDVLEGLGKVTKVIAKQSVVLTESGAIMMSKQ